MDKINNYNVVFSSLTLGKHSFEFEVTQSFFDLFDFDQDFRKPKITVDLDLIKNTTFLNLAFHLSGDVEVDCDITGNPYRQPIEGDMELVVKFGHEFDDSDDEVWIIPDGEYEINVAQLIYELTLLSIPNKRVNPNLDTEDAQEALDLLDKYMPRAIDDEEIDTEDKSIDPRWDSLKNLLNKK